MGTPGSRLPSLSRWAYGGRFEELSRFDDTQRHAAWEQATAFIYQSSWYWFIFILLGIPVGGPAVWLGQGRIRRSLRRQLCERGIPVCIACAYDLRGQVELRCPECGRRFEAALLDRAQQL